MSSVKQYTQVTAALLGLLLLTVGAAYIDLGPLNTVVAMSISLAKGALILLFFMHLRYGSGLIRIAALAGIFWLGILFVLALSDFLTRG
ncbi:cytochrome C oxidase subunit IV family protein [Verrucomicrobiota bacterium sgz303538]